MRPSLTMATIVLLGALGCNGITGPGARDAPYSLSARRAAGIEVDLSASASSVAPGETVQLTVTAHNSSTRRIQIGVHCGPPMDAAIIAPTGQVVSALSEMIGSNGASTCELAEYHFADPGEVEVVRITWRAPLQRGVYRAIGGVRGEKRDLHT